MSKFNNELKNYQPIPRELIFDNKMSDRARFVYCYMASKPDDWKFYLKSMAKDIGYSVDTLKKYIKELTETGWLIKGKQINEKGKFGAVEYTLKATKNTNTKNTDTEKYRYGKIPIPHNKDNNKKDKDNINLDCKLFVKPILEEIKNFILENNFIVDAEMFFNYYESNGWMVGRYKMKDWQACVRTWERKEKQYAKRNPIPQKKETYMNLDLNEIWKNR